ncbi:MAG: hypothetical protein R3A45_09450 [Bdellovibrionota bacterium]
MYKTQLFLLSFFLFIATGFTNLVHADQGLVKCDIEVLFVSTRSGGGNSHTYRRYKKMSLTKVPGSNQPHLIAELSAPINDDLAYSDVINKNGSYLIFDIIAHATSDAIVISSFAVTDPTPVTISYDGRNLIKDYGYKKIAGSAFSGSIEYDTKKTIHSENGYSDEKTKLITGENRSGFHIHSITSVCKPLS